MNPRFARVAIAFVGVALVAAALYGASRPGYTENPASATIPRAVAQQAERPAAPALGTSASLEPPERLGTSTAPALSKGSPDPAPSRLVSVKRAAGVSAADFESAALAEGLRVVETIPEIGWAVVEPVDPSRSAADAIESLTDRPWATLAEPVSTVYPAMTPSDPNYGLQWGFKNSGQLGGTSGADANSEPALDWSRGADTVVAVVDTGVDFRAPDLAGRSWVNADEIAGNSVDDDGNGKVDDVNGWDFYRNDATVFDEVDGDKHGTHVAGTVGAATNNAIAGAGMAPETAIMSVKFLGESGGSDVNGAAGIVYAVDNGADVVNCSWGGGTSTTVLSDAMAYAAARNVLVVIAAGNSAVNNDVTPFYPASLESTNIVSVAALEQWDGLASFSNYGATTVDIGAPGQGIYSEQPVLPGALLVEQNPYKIVYYGFPVESVTDATARQSLVTNSMSAIATTTSDPVLVVDDGWGTIFGEGTWRRARYTAALTAAGYTNVTVHSTQTSGTPTAGLMAGKVVVWFTGATTAGYGATYMTFSSTERTQLTTYLNAGGRMLISSGDAGYDTAWVGGTALTWYHAYLHAAYIDDDPWTGTGAGRAGSLIDGVAFTVDDPIRGTDGYDDVGAYDGYATPIADYEGYATISGTSMAAPHVSGALALAIARNPGESAAALKARLMATTVPVAALAGKCVTGGRMDTAATTGEMAAPSGFSAWYAGVGSVAMSWVDDGADPHFAATRVLARTGAWPASPSDPLATQVYEGAAQAATQTGIPSGTQVYYSAYSRNSLGTWTEVATATATVSDPPGTISGTVLGLDGLPAYRMVASAFDATSHAYVKAVFTDVNGQYSMTGLAPGGYHVRYLSSAGTAVGAYPYFDLKRTVSDATTVAVASGQTATASMRMTPAPAASSIVGTVTASGVAQAGVVVSAFNATTHAHVKGVFTDALGRYAIAGLPAGSYHVRFTNTTPSTLTQYYDHQSTISAASVVTMGESATVTVTTDLAAVTPPASGSIAGTVTAAAVPQNRVVVGAFNAVSGAYVRAVFTDAAGAYRIGSLAPGNYKVRFSNTAPSTLTQWYLNVATMGAATPVAVSDGVTTTVSTDLLGL
ncbi:MAG: S8 family serine peptidase [Coriobacteriia bacterium]|nr:S8 family serine peptidase [Coriobacteriia bacterium]